MNFTQEEILQELDLSFHGIPSSYYPSGNRGDIKYNFFLDLEHGFCETAGSRIHLYADTLNWAIVFEKSCYQIKGFDSVIELIYVGNCIEYSIDKQPHRNYITNLVIVTLISSEEYERITNENGGEMELYELISASAKKVNIHNKEILIEHDPFKYDSLGIELRDYDNPNKLIGFTDLLRYINETDPTIISATEDEIKKYFKRDIPKIMTINNFHFKSIYDKSVVPSMQETYQLIAKILFSQDIAFWQPTLEANNHWSNWESGGL